MKEQHTQSATAIGAAMTTAMARAEAFVPKSTKNHAPRIPLTRTETTTAPQAPAQKDVVAKLRQEKFTLVFCGHFQKFVEAMKVKVLYECDESERTKSPEVPVLDSYNLAKVILDDLLCRVAVHSINVLVNSRNFYKVYVNCVVGKGKGFGVPDKSNDGVPEKFLRKIAELTYCKANMREDKDNGKTLLVLKEQSLRLEEVKIHFAIEIAK